MNFAKHMGKKPSLWVFLAVLVDFGSCAYSQNTWTTINTGNPFDNFGSVSADGRYLLGSSFFYSGAWGGEAAALDLVTGQEINLGCLDPLDGPYNGAISTASKSTENLNVVIGTSITPCILEHGHYDEDGNRVRDSIVTSNYYGGFRWTAVGGMRSLGSWSVCSRSADSYGISPGEVIPYSITVDGTKIVGEARYKSFSDTEDRMGAFVWTEAKGLSHLPDIGGGGISAAYAISRNGNAIAGCSGRQACVWSVGGDFVIGLLPGYVSSIAKDISDDGSLVAGTCGTNGPTTLSQAFVWNAATGVVGIGSLPEWESSEALAVASDGSFIIGRAVHWYIGGYSWITGLPNWKVDYQAFIWDEQHGIRDLATVLGDSHGLVFDWRLGTLREMSEDAKTLLFDSETWRDWMGNDHRTDMIRLSLPVYALTGTGVGTPMRSWRLTHFGNADNSGDGASLNDLDKDGLPNLLEYAFGGDPRVPDNSITCTTPNVSAGKLQIRFKCDAACTDISYTVQASQALDSGAWTDIARSTSGAAVVPIGTLSDVSDSGTGQRTVTVTASTEVFPAGRGFLRIKISE